jgi:hypothetical protein
VLVILRNKHKHPESALNGVGVSLMVNSQSVSHHEHACFTCLIDHLGPILFIMPKVAKISSGGIISMKYAVLPTNFATA